MTTHMRSGRSCVWWGVEYDTLLSVKFNNIMKDWQLTSPGQTAIITKGCADSYMATYFTTTSQLSAQMCTLYFIDVLHIFYYLSPHTKMSQNIYRMEVFVIKFSWICTHTVQNTHNLMSFVSKIRIHQVWVNPSIIITIPCTVINAQSCIHRYRQDGHYYDESHKEKMSPLN